MKILSPTAPLVFACVIFLAACGGGDKAEGDGDSNEAKGGGGAHLSAEAPVEVASGQSAESMRGDPASSESAAPVADPTTGAGGDDESKEASPAEVVAASTSGGEAMTGSQEIPKGDAPEEGPLDMVGPADYRDEHLALELPEGMVLRAEPDKRTYLAVEDQTEIYLIKVEQEAVTKETLEEIAGKARQSTMESLGVVTETPGSKVTSTVVEVGEVEARDLKEEGGQAFSFTFITEAKEGDQIGKAVTTMGYGNVGGALLWFQHTGPEVEKHPDAAVEFLGRLEVDVPTNADEGNASEGRGEP